MSKKIEFMLDGGRDVLKLEVKADTDIADVREALKAKCAPKLDQFAAIDLKLYLTTDGNVAHNQPEVNPADPYSVITDKSTVVIHHPSYKTEGSAKIAQHIWIRRWIGTDISCREYAAPSNYKLFRGLLQRAFNFPTTGKVYYFPDDNPLNIVHRIPVNDEPSFQQFLSICPEQSPVLYLWKIDLTASPQHPPPLDETKTEPEPAESVTSDTSRGSAQTVWSLGVKALDDWRCVVCSNDLRVNLQASHIIPINAAQDLQTAHLATPYEARNGVTMCGNCHSLYEDGYYWFDENGLIHVSEALKSKSEWAARDGTAIARTTARTTENWPTAAIVAFSQQKAVDAQKKRHATDEKPFQCPKCGKGYTNDNQYYARHVKNCSGKMKLCTPAKKANVADEKAD